MSDFTKHLRLIKPSGNDYYNVEQFNHNAELIDKETEDLSNKVAKIQEGATREKAGIVQFGTEEGKALEGMMLARLAGAYGYGGDIQDEGVKNPNYIYYDRNTRKMYKCLKQNQDISANVANFIPLDNNSLLERLENLITLYSSNEWNILEFSNKKVLISLRKKAMYSNNKYIYELPFEISNPVILTSSEDTENQFFFTATIEENKAVIKRWPGTILTGWNFLDILVIGYKKN
ncbi:hypothetical protein [Fusobacterium animalis]|uniref:hypothetical protein n=1 Tax=Fusobacterium animalis TaxID=76859 RepID=UPI0021C4A84E|nr:hypothetical protein [Fusobacterium animalis]